MRSQIKTIDWERVAHDLTVYEHFGHRSALMTYREEVIDEIRSTWKAAKMRKDDSQGSEDPQRLPLNGDGEGIAAGAIRNIA